MLDFSLTPEQESLKRMLADFTQEEVLPHYSHWDRTGEFPREIWNKMVDLGLGGVRVPVEYGGQNLDCVTTGIITEEISKGDFNLAYTVVLSSLAGEVLTAAGTPKAKEEWLPRVVNGALLALALTEPHCGSDAAALKCRAVRSGDEYLINGEKSASTLMMAADGIMLFARTDPSQKSRGISAFVVPTDLPGVSRGSYEDLGSKAIRRGSAFFEDARIPAHYLLGNEGQGFHEVMHMFDYSRILLGLMCLGAAQQSLEETMRYVKERTAFGQPIAKFEGVSFPIADFATRIEAARWLSYRGLWQRDQGQPHTKEAAMVKWLAPSLSVQAIHECILLHGHYGYTQEFPHEQRLRDVMGLEIGDGTAQIQKIIISREMMGREYLPY